MQLVLVIQQSPVLAQAPFLQMMPLLLHDRPIFVP
jgi:hypothetical protein